MAYHHATADLFCVDDIRSPFYGRITHQAQGKWRSAEPMRVDPLYEFALVINHNPAPISKGAGSCIFVHPSGGSAGPTLGCTAMTRQNLLVLLTWLDPARASWIALPTAQYQALKTEWQLP